MVGIENEDNNTVEPPSYDDTMLDGVEPHPEYYSKRGNLTVEVNGFVFKISDYKFWTHSDFFSVLARENDSTLGHLANGGSENRVWVFKDVTPDEFACLLWILYPPDHGECKATTLKHWEAILKLADRWKFLDIFNLAVRKISALEIDPVRKIRLMHEHKIREEWAIDAFVVLTLRDNFPDAHGTKVLGIKLARSLALARERNNAQMFWSRGNGRNARQIVCEVFGLNGELGDPGSWKAE